MTRLLTPAATYAETCENFRWQLPDRSSIADLICDRHAVNRDRLALIHHVGSQVRHYTFREIQRNANQFASTLTELGMRMGDRLMVYLPQHPVTAIAPLRFITCAV